MNRLVVSRAPSYQQALVIVVFSTFLTMLAYAGPLGNVATLTGELTASPVGTTWLLASMSIGLAVTLLVAGVLADEIGHRRVFVIGAAVFVVANLACALATTAAVFVIARIVAGVGATGMIATGLGLVAAVTDHDEQRSRTGTWWSVAMGGGIAVGPILTGLLDLAAGWRFFYAGLAAAGVAVAWAARRLPDRDSAGDDRPRRLDVVGFVLLTASLASLVAAIVEVRAGGSRAASMMFVIAGVLIVGLVISQRRGTTTMLDRRLFRRGRFLAATVAAFGTGLGVIATMSYACSFLVTGLDTSTLSAGVLLAAWSGTSAVAALVFARLRAVSSTTTQLVGGLLGVALGLALLTGLSAHSGPTRLLPGLVVSGIATGLLNAGLARAAVGSVPRANAAMGTGANNTARYIGASLGVTVASAIAATSHRLVDGWNLVALLGAAASLIIAALVAVLTRWGGHVQHPVS